MQTPLVGHKIIFLKCIDSTNNYSVEAFRSGEIDSGTVVVADFQTKGKGQRGKKWNAKSGLNLLVSITADLDLWKVKNIISLNHIIALSIQYFLFKYISDVSIKWPNDIMVSDKKIAGILIETQVSSSYKKAIIGFGININQHSFAVPRATSLSIETHELYDPKEFLPEIIKILNDLIGEYQVKGEDYLYHLYNQQLWKLNQKHPFDVNGIKKIGEIISTTMDGHLIVGHSDIEKHYFNGEVKY